MMGDKITRDKMVKISKSGNIVEEDIFLICEIIGSPVSLSSVHSLNFPINSFMSILTFTGGYIILTILTIFFHEFFGQFPGFGTDTV